MFEKHRGFCGNSVNTNQGGNHGGGRQIPGNTATKPNYLTLGRRHIPASAQSLNGGFNPVERGRFIVFEGGEGCGKSTQARELKSRLIKAGKNVVLTREPGGTPGAEEIRSLLVNGTPDRWLPMSETLLFMAARFDHIERLIKPALATGIWVVSDRFIDSSIVYQGVVRGVGVSAVKALYDSLMGLYPDLTIVLDIDPRIGLTRKGPAVQSGVKEDRFEQFPLAFHEKLRTAYNYLALTEPHHAMVNGAMNPNLVQSAIWDIVKEHLLS